MRCSLLTAFLVSHSRPSEGYGNGASPRSPSKQDRSLALLLLDLPLPEEGSCAFPLLPAGECVDGRAVAGVPGSVEGAAVAPGALLHLLGDPVDALP
jgi:hypothetical protein